LCTILTAECKKVDDGHNSGDKGATKAEAHSGFNVGFELKFWEAWCAQCGTSPSKPVLDAIKLMGEDKNNFMKKHRQLRNNGEGDFWVFLKADTKKDITQLYEVCCKNVDVIQYNLV
jgi:hypothetical protein